MTPPKRKTAGDKFREELVADFELEGPGDAVLLDQVCATLNLLERMNAQVAADGDTITGARGQVIAHPLLKEIARHDQVVTRLIRMLCPANPVPSMKSAAGRAAWAARHRR